MLLFIKSPGVTKTIDIAGNGNLVSILSVYNVTFTRATGTVTAGEVMWKHTHPMSRHSTLPASTPIPSNQLASSPITHSCYRMGPDNLKMEEKKVSYWLYVAKTTTKEK